MPGNHKRHVKRFRDLLRHHDPEACHEDALIELLRSARHWCDANRKDYALNDRRAHLLYLADLHDGGGL
jgi:hypothetical protein